VESRRGLVRTERCQQARDFRLELRYAAIQKPPDRRVVDSAVRVCQLSAERNDRADVSDAGGQFWMVLQCYAKRLADDLELTLHGRPQERASAV
jgi:hypothetical protein